MKDKVNEYQNKLDCLNIINSIHKLESDMHRLDTKFRYATINNNASNNRNMNEDVEESKDVEQNNEESKHGESLSQNNCQRQIDELPCQSKQLI